LISVIGGDFRRMWANHEDLRLSLLAYDVPEMPVGDNFALPEPVETMLRIDGNRRLEQELLKLLCTTTLTEDEARKELCFPRLGRKSLNVAFSDTRHLDRDDPIERDWSA